MTLRTKCYFSPAGGPRVLEKKTLEEDLRCLKKGKQDSRRRTPSDIKEDVVFIITHVITYYFVSSGRNSSIQTGVTLGISLVTVVVALIYEFSKKMFYIAIKL